MTVAPTTGFARRPAEPFGELPQQEFAAAIRRNYAGISDRSRPLAFAELVLILFCRRSLQ
jgi:hypothetical protein